jgi:uncharacterized delta-60 repeat protein
MKETISALQIKFSLALLLTSLATGACSNDDNDGDGPGDGGRAGAAGKAAGGAGAGGASSGGQGGGGTGGVGTGGAGTGGAGTGGVGGGPAGDGGVGGRPAGAGGAGGGSAGTSGAGGGSAGTSGAGGGSAGTSGAGGGSAGTSGAGGGSAGTSGAGGDPIDVTFGQNGFTYFNYEDFYLPNIVSVDPQGGVLVGGGFKGSLWRLRADGSVDLDFGVNGIAAPADATFVSDALVRQPDGNVVVGGFFANLANQAGFLRLRPDGSVDPSFGLNGVAILPLPPGEWGHVRALALDEGGRIVAAGDYRKTEEERLLWVARLGPDGTLDTGFHAPEGYALYGSGDEEGVDVSVRPDGSIDVVGFGPNAARTPPDKDLLLLRYTSDGALDPTFGQGGIQYLDGLAAGGPGALDDFATCSVRTADGSFVVGGFQLTDDGDGLLARHRPDGSLDAAFGQGGFVTFGWPEGYGVVNDVLALPDGAFFVAGTFGVNGGPSHAFFARLLPNGALDPRFGEGGIYHLTTFAASLSYRADLQPDGKVVVGAEAFLNGDFADVAIRLNLP